MTALPATLPDQNTMTSLTDDDFAYIFAPLNEATGAGAGLGPRKKSAPQVKMALTDSPATNQLVLFDASVGTGAGATSTVSAPAPTLPTHFDQDEHFCETTLQAMLKDEAINVEDRVRLRHYWKDCRKGAPGIARIRYVLPKGTGEKGLGRLTPEHNIGLQGFPKMIRNALASKFYWDIDLENAHYYIASHLCAHHHLPHEAIDYYIAHRAECLATFPTRDAGKLHFLRTLFGGDVSLYCESTRDEPTTAVGIATAMVSRITGEITALAKRLYLLHPDLVKVKSGKKNEPIEKRYNKEFVLMSVLFQEEEKKALFCLKQFLAANGRSMEVLIHDGGLVLRLEGELLFPADLLVRAEEHLHKTLGYPLSLVVKTMDHSYVAPTHSADAYTRMKQDFDKTHFMVGSLLNCLIEDGTRLEMKWSDAVVHYANLSVPELEETAKGEIKTKMVPFLTKWLKDPERPTFIKCDFIPNRETCPKSVFNLFHGFQAESLPPVPVEEVAGLIAPILAHMDALTSGHKDYFVKWMANLFQSPEVKSDISILFRDMGGLLFEGGGTGKNLFFDWVGRKILGSDYYVVVGDNSMLYGAFNSVFEGKLLVFVEEAAGKDNHANTDRLQSKITSRKTIVNKKCVAEREMNDFTRYWFASNNPNSLPSKGGMTRRIQVVDTQTGHRGNKAYFDALVTAMEDPRVQRAFFQYLMTVETWKTPIEFFNNRPLTDAYYHVRQLNAPIHYKWLCYELRRGRLPTSDTSRTLYNRFKDWAMSSGERKADTMPSETAFCKLMSEAYTEEAEGVVTDAPTTTLKTSGVIVRRFDVPKLVAGLVKLHFLKDGEVPLDKDGCQIVPVTGGVWTGVLAEEVE